MKFRKKPVIIEAVKLENEHSSIYHAIEFISDVDMNTSKIGAAACIKKAQEDGGLVIHTLEGDMKASFGDYIIKGVNGEFYPCKPDVFDKTYEPVMD